VSSVGDIFAHPYTPHPLHKSLFLTNALIPERRFFLSLYLSFLCSVYLSRSTTVPLYGLPIPFFGIPYIGTGLRIERSAYYSLLSPALKQCPKGRRHARGVKKIKKRTSTLGAPAMAGSPASLRRETPSHPNTPNSRVCSSLRTYLHLDAYEEA